MENNTTEPIKLTQFSKGAGCGCKIAPNVLQEILHTTTVYNSPNLLVGNGNNDDAAVYQQKYLDAWNIVNDQNNLGKWSGGHTRLTSVWQPRQYRQYNIK